MRIQFYVKLFFMFLALASASVVNFILFKTIQKTLELKIKGVQTKAQVVDKDSFKLKFYVQDQVFYFEGQKPGAVLKNDGLDIIYNPKNPKSASTLAQYKFLNSFLGLMVIVFFVLGIAIFGFLKKIIISLKAYY